MKSTTLATLLTLTGSLGLLSDVSLADHSHDFSQQSSLHTASGMLLGVYAQSTHDGLVITGTIPGYSAEGRLFAGDILTQATAAEMPVFPIRSHLDMEQAKSQIGPFREAAVEFFRPGVGLMYAWVTFQPIGGGSPQPHVHNHTPQPALGGNTFPGSGGFPSNGFPAGGFPAGPSSNPNNIVMKMEHLPGQNGGPNPNNFQPRSGNPGAPAVNPNNSSPFSGKLPASPNNTTPKFSGGASSPDLGKFKAEFKLESEKPGARLMFRKPQGTQSSSFPSPLVTPGTKFSQATIPQSAFPQSRIPQAGSQQQSGPQLGPLQQQLQQLKRQQRNRVFGN